MSIQTPKTITTLAESRAHRPTPVPIARAEQKFSLQRMTQFGQKLPEDSVEVKESKALAQITGIGERRVGELISLSRLAKFAQRDLSAGSATAGGDLIQDTLTDGIVGALHPHSVVVKLGAQVWPNQKGGFVSPVLSTGPSGYVAGGENQTVTIDTAAQFNALELQPIRLSTELHVSRHLVIQAKDRSLEQFLANEILKSLGALLDKVVLNGQSATSATASAPGLVGNTNLFSITFGGAPSWAKILSARYAVNNANFPNDKRGWVVSPNAEQILAATPKLASYPSFLADLDLGQIAGDRYEVTTNLAGTDQLVYGRFAEAAVVIWNGVLDVLFDPYSLAHQNLIRILVNVMANGGPLRPGFCYSIDSAAQ
jgi:HK97 family phage major capsid protein